MNSKRLIEAFVNGAETEEVQLPDGRKIEFGRRPGGVGWDAQFAIEVRELRQSWPSGRAGNWVTVYADAGPSFSALLARYKLFDPDNYELAMERAKGFFKAIAKLSLD